MEERLTLLLIAAVIAGAPLLYAAIGEVVSETAGVLNLELEAMMLCGAFADVGATLVTGNIVIGFAGAALGGLLVACVHGVTSLVFSANQVVSVVALNILAAGITAFLLAAWLGPRASQSIGTLSAMPIPLLADLPVVGRAFFAQSPAVYAAYLTVPLG